MGVLVLGYDNSEGSGHALEVAIDMAKSRGDRIVVVFGYSPGGLQPGEELKAYEQAVADVGLTKTRDALEQITSAGVEGEVKLVAKAAAEALVSAAEELDARAIVVGSYGESALRGAILGSTPHKLLHLSRRPVLVVPANPGQ